MALRALCNISARPHCLRSTTAAYYSTPSISLPLSESQKKTIYALSTPKGKGGVGVIRISGPQSLDAWRSVVKSGRQDPEPWKMNRCKIVHPLRKDDVLDDGMAVFFKGPKSFTSEDVLELHIHSGRAITSSVLDALSSIPGLRHAEAGEFTKRAFKSGRIDLTQAEGIKDMIEAETDAQRRIAVGAAMGISRVKFTELRDEIIGCLALIEALIDFGEGEDIEEGVYDQARTRAQTLLTTIEGHLSDRRRGELLRSGVRLAIFGPPNAGKSTLLNFLAQREAAIVTPIPGTTRDILELSLDIGGIPVLVGDTAGVRETEDLVEEIGVERAKKAVQAADISLCVLPLPELRPHSKDIRLGLAPEIQELIDEKTVFLFNKADLVSGASQNTHSTTGTEWQVSLSTGQGCKAFLSGFEKILQERFDLSFDSTGQDRNPPLITHSRHRVHLQSAADFLRVFLDYGSQDVVLGAEELRYAAQAVGRISGTVDVEDVLDVVFREFCIGK